MKRSRHHSKNIRGFTLMELLIVMTIISILAAVAFPAYHAIQMAARMNGSMQHARGIGTGLQLYSMDNSGFFPKSESREGGRTLATSNDAFRLLVPDYIDDEGVFAVKGSAWGDKADNKIEPETEILKSGENHFAYIMGLSSSSRSGWPLVVDGTNGSGRYNREEGTRGGTWQGKKAIVVHVDLSSEVVPLKGPDNARYIPRIGDENADALEVAGYMPEGVKLLEPAR